jgi:hypothetical protein
MLLPDVTKITSDLSPCNANAASPPTAASIANTTYSLVMGSLLVELVLPKYRNYLSGRSAVADTVRVFRVLLGFLWVNARL